MQEGVVAPTSGPNNVANTPNAERVNVSRAGNTETLLAQ
jgi:hypothetical protein